MRILVTDGNERSALAVTRALGRRGHEVTVLSWAAGSLAARSRHARAERVVPSSLAAPGAFVEALVRLAGSMQPDAILPIGEASLLAVLSARDRLGAARVPFPSIDTFRAVCDKGRVLEMAGALGIAVPHQRVAATAADFATLAREPLPFPLVAKPSRSVAAGATGLEKLRVRHVPDAATLARLADELPPAAFPVLLQQRVVGPGTGIFLLLWDGKARAVFAHRRLREKPPSGGVSVYSESVPAEPDLVARSLELLQAFGWQGVAMVEYKRDAATGVPYLMEINGRFWGSLQLAIDSGVDFPNLLLDCAFGGAPDAPPPFRTGRRLRWLWGDVDHLLMRLGRDSRSLDLPPDAPGRARVVLDFATAWRPGQRCESWRLADPAPFLHETAEWFGGLLGAR
jgi:predicted ATP-grasp superfamily ATP-dependent carboligase